LSENKQVAANYLINFYNDILALNNIYAAYINLRAELQGKTNGKQDLLKNLDEEDTAKIKNLMDNARFVMSRIYIQYRSLANNSQLKDKLDQENLNKYKEAYDKAKIKVIIELDDIEEACILLNQLIVEEVIGALLMTSQDFFMKSYGVQEKPTN